MFARLDQPGAMPDFEIQRLIARHGRRAVLLAMLRALRPQTRRRTRRIVNAHDLSPHLRRDIGLD